MLTTRSSKSTKQLTTSIDQAQTCEATRQATTFDDLIVDGSLSAVRVKVRPTRKRKKRAAPAEALLTELQCEV